MPDQYQSLAHSIWSTPTLVGLLWLFTGASARLPSVIFLRAFCLIL